MQPLVDRDLQYIIPTVKPVVEVVANLVPLDHPGLFKFTDWNKKKVKHRKKKEKDKLKSSSLLMLQNGGDGDSAISRSYSVGDGDSVGGDDMSDSSSRAGSEVTMTSTQFGSDVEGPAIVGVNSEHADREVRFKI